MPGPLALRPIGVTEVFEKSLSSGRADRPRKVELCPGRLSLDVGTPAIAREEMEVKERLPAEVEHTWLLLDHVRPRAQIRQHVPKVPKQFRRTVGDGRSYLVAGRVSNCESTARPRASVS